MDLASGATQTCSAAYGFAAELTTVDVGPTHLVVAAVARLAGHLLKCVASLGSAVTVPEQLWRPARWGMQTATVQSARGGGEPDTLVFRRLDPGTKYFVACGTAAPSEPAPSHSLQVLQGAPITTLMPAADLALSQGGVSTSSVVVTVRPGSGALRVRCVISTEAAAASADALWAEEVTGCEGNCAHGAGVTCADGVAPCGGGLVDSDVTAAANTPVVSGTSTCAAPRWVELDLGAVRLLNRARFWHDPGQRICSRRLDLRATASGVWHTVYRSGAGLGRDETDAGLRIDFDDRLARYARYYAGADGPGLRFTELALYHRGADALPRRPPPCGGANACAAVGVSAAGAWRDVVIAATDGGGEAGAEGGREIRFEFGGLRNNTLHFVACAATVPATSPVERALLSSSVARVGGGLRTLPPAPLRRAGLVLGNSKFSRLSSLVVSFRTGRALEESDELHFSLPDAWSLLPGVVAALSAQTLGQAARAGLQVGAVRASDAAGSKEVVCPFVTGQPHAGPVTIELSGLRNPSKPGAFGRALFSLWTSTAAGALIEGPSPIRADVLVVGAGCGPPGFANAVFERSGGGEPVGPSFFATAGEQLVGSCAEGYVDVAASASASGGPSLLTCGADGSYDAGSFQCVPDSCAGRDALLLGAVQAVLPADAPVAYGSTVTYSCNAGYAFAGPTTASRTCALADASGAADAAETDAGAAAGSVAWTGNAAVCAPIACEGVPGPLDAERDGDGHTFGSTVSFTCPDGGETSSRTCGADGHWEGQAAFCTVLADVELRFRTEFGTALGIDSPAERRAVVRRVEDMVLASLPTERREAVRVKSTMKRVTSMHMDWPGVLTAGERGVLEATLQELTCGDPPRPGCAVRITN